MESGLRAALLAQASEARTDQRRWLEAAQAKVEWCAGRCADRYAVSAKLAALQELAGGRAEGRARLDAAAARTALLQRAVADAAERGRLEAEAGRAERDWDAFVTELDEAK